MMAEPEPEPSRHGVPAAAAWLGGAGLLPFAGLAVLALVLDGPAGETVHGALVGYGAVILSFMGGCRWGFAAAGLGAGPDWPGLALSVIPALFGWIVLTAGGALAPVLLSIGFAALLLADVALTVRGGAPAWWPRLRWPLTLGAVASLLIGSMN